ncbi:alginate lyase family protein [Pelagicoccus sp. SDUM812005]|uniref:alginate lyase family protein n=1 Tax=Pelagicoccus sp. SDUM812005 TaxID=3041257 RepID=UPI002811AE97|nr:alginate lyase family protein [Pelagicoccus sp. SDUM812005]
MIPLWGQAEVRTSVGKTDLSDWVGIENLDNGVATIRSGDSISFTYENMNRRYSGLLRPFLGDAADWYDYAGVSFELYLEKDSAAEVSVTFNTDPLDHLELNPSSSAKVLVNGQGWQKVYLPWALFDVNAGQLGNTLQAVKELKISASSAKNKSIKLRKVELLKGEQIALDAEVQGHSAPAGESVQYVFEIGNTTDEVQAVQLLVERVGWESMTASLSTASLKVSPGDVKTVTLDVAIPASLPQGIREKQVVRAVPNGQGSAAETIAFHTAVKVPTPNIVFTAEKWQAVRDKVDNYAWAAEELADLERKVSKWEVPAGAPVEKHDNRNEYKPIFTKHEGGHLYDCGVAYQLTGKVEYAEKVAKLFRRLISMEDGYPVTLHGGSNSFVGEGVFFQGVGRAYDMVRDSGVFTEEEHRLVEHTFRLYVERTIKGNTRGAISNWNVAELTGAFYCALALQDWSLVDSLLNSHSGLYAQMYHGIMGDGWWYECAVGYNTWVASEFSEIALALEPWGLNLKDRKFQIGTTPHFSLQASRRVGGLHGMEFEKWGSINQNSIGIKDMWDAAIPFLDYRGVIFAVNDAQEAYVTGKPYELAYYMYGDPEYAAVINRGEKRDLLYGVPELPQVTSEKMTQSAYADNFGAVMLRSQTPNREQREQIQAVLHYGSHGGHHGHFDRLNLISLMRYGRSFYNPEMFWYGYQSYLYKFLVQTSMTKNMVVVDQKQQEPRESFRTFYHEGEMMQATVVESNSRWSHPPYGGMTYGQLGGISFKEKTEMENRSLFIPEDQPEYGLCTDYTEEIMQRRLMVVTDDYVVLADYYDAEQEHTYDWLIHVKGFQGITGDSLEKVRHTGQMNTDPLSAAQFFTDCQWYRADGASRASFETRWGEGADNKGARMPNSEDGVLKMDVFNAWPLEKEIMIGTAPENFAVNKRFAYTVAADGETLVDDSTGAWVLGAKEIEADLRGKKELVLRSRTEKPRNNTLFWGDARLVLKDGSEVFISSLPARYENVIQPQQGQDYYGGPIKIQGIPMAKSTPAQPKDPKQAGVVTVDLSGMEVVSFKATVGGDFPLGDESQRRKTLAVRSSGKEARYLSVIEPYETESLVESVEAKSANELTVKLKDGRIQVIKFQGLEEGEDIKLSIREYKDGKLIREELRDA